MLSALVDFKRIVVTARDCPSAYVAVRLAMSTRNYVSCTRTIAVSGTVMTYLPWLSTFT